MSLDGWDLITKIEEPDKYTVVYRLKKPYSSFAVTFFSTGGANPAILPQHLLRGLRNLNTTPYNSLPVGIGPFKFAAWHRGDSVVMERNPNYFRGAPKLDRVIFKIVPNANTTLEQLRTHELDLWLPIAPHYYPQTQAIPGISGNSIPSYTFDHLDFNLTHPMLQDVKVREALRYALDRADLLHKVLNNLYLLAESPVTPASSYDAHLPLIPHDIAKANALLDADGWKRGPDGIRSKGGLTLRLTYVVTIGQADYDTEAELIRSWWKQIGVDMIVKHYLSSQMFATAANGGILYGGKFDVARFGWGADPNEDLSNLYACYRFPPNGQNDLRWCDRAATAAIDRAKENYDKKTRAKDIDLVQDALYAQVPTVILYARKELAAYNSDLKGWHPNSISPFDDMMNVDI
ncbi:MAG: peptide ABC transporter substrate-binding protein [Candidatus Eremiobacteraeota bacterium]|nr:peptide ABC transporter substrate-binding protein [Candidatus Eremiobacteraeota bacterium]